MFITQTQSICFFPISIFNQSEALNKRFWRNEKLTKFQLLGDGQNLAVNRKGPFRGIV